MWAFACCNDYIGANLRDQASITEASVTVVILVAGVPEARNAWQEAC